MSLPEPSDSDLAIIEHIDRYRMSTLQIILRRVLPQSTPNATRKQLHRLTRQRWLARFSFLQQKSYYVLTRTACETLGISVRRSYPLKQSGLLHHYAVLIFCDRFEHQLIKRDEFSN